MNRVWVTLLLLSVSQNSRIAGASCDGRKLAELTADLHEKAALLEALTEAASKKVGSKIVVSVFITAYFLQDARIAELEAANRQLEAQVVKANRREFLALVSTLLFSTFF